MAEKLRDTIGQFIPQSITLVESTGPLIEGETFQENGKPKLIENGQPVKRVKMSGVVQMSDTPNRNGRRYGTPVWDKQFSEDSPFMKDISRGAVLGEIEHPESGTTDLKRVSHRMDKVYRNEGTKEIHADVTILKTPMGAILEELASIGYPLAMSSRGVGEVRKGKDGIMDVDEDAFELKTFDFVYSPSVEQSELHVVEDKSEKKVDKPVTEEQSKIDTTSDTKEVKLMGNEKRVIEAITKARLMLESSKNLSGCTPAQLVETQTKIAELVGVFSGDTPAEYDREVGEVKGRLTAISEDIQKSLEEKALKEADEKKQKGVEGVEVLNQVLSEGKRLRENHSRAVSEGDIAYNLLEKLLAKAKSIQIENTKLRKMSGRGVNESEMREIMDISEKLLAKGKRLQQENVRLKKDYSILSEKYAKAMGLLERVVEKQRGKTVATEVARVIKQNPTLAAAESFLSESKDIAELNQRVASAKKIVESSGVKYPNDLPPVAGAENLNEDSLATSKVVRKKNNLITALAESEKRQKKTGR